MRLLIALAMAVGIATVPVQQAFACDCMQTTVEDATAFADAVFAGTVVGQEPVGGEPVGALAATAPMPGAMGESIYTFAVDGVAKGEVATEAQVLSGGDEASCGMSFGMGERWLVFTTWDGAIHRTGLCNGNMPLGPDEDPPLALIAPTASEASAPFEIPWTAVAILVAIVTVAGVSFLAFRRS
jgi:hypothetical protein